MQVLGEIDGQKYDADTFLAQLQDDTTREAIGRLIHVLRSIECAQCRWHHWEAEIVLTGTCLRNMSVDIVACCDEFADVVDRTVHTEIRPRAPGRWLPWTRVGAI